MLRVIRAGALACAVVLLGCQQPTWQQSASTNKPRKNVMVQFTDANLHPSVAQVLAGGSVVWINYSSLYDGTVVFPLSIRDAFTCKQLRPLFMETDTGFQSIPIGQDSENVTLPCPLKPGEYDYTLNLFQTTRQNPASQMDNPDVSMHGRIVVK